ncbi:uncharacterized protein LOC135191517 isoform X2 [Pogoniulus pusillus]
MRRIKWPWVALPGELQELSWFLGSRKWFVGDKITYVDFVALDLLDLQHQILAPECPELQGRTWASSCSASRLVPGPALSPPSSLPTHSCPYPRAQHLRVLLVSPAPLLTCRVPVPMAPQALEQISAYLRSGLFLRFPILGPTAKWCNTKAWAG